MNQVKEKTKEATKTIKVRCTFEIDVEVPSDENYNEIFDIEDNHCPGTGLVGMAFDKVYEDSKENHHCWACALKGKNEILND